MLPQVTFKLADDSDGKAPAELQVSLTIVLVLAIDTATPAVTCGVLRLVDGVVTPLAERVTINARSHAEILTPHILECLEEAGNAPHDLGAVVVGTGPGPFTGLRVGMATAAAFGDALGIPVHGVCSLDAIAFAAADNVDDDIAMVSELLVVTDARRREIYWARYRGADRISGPDVIAPADLDPAGATVVAGSAPHAAMFSLPARPIESPSPSSLVSLAAAAIESGSVPAPLIPLYLRRPDAKTLEERAAAKARS